MKLLGLEFYFFFAWYDLWIGIFIDTKKKCVYIGILTLMCRISHYYEPILRKTVGSVAQKMKTKKAQEVLKQLQEAVKRFEKINFVNKMFQL